MMMCVDKDKLLELCELFPQTAENISARALDRRASFMRQRELNSNFHHMQRQHGHVKKVSQSSFGTDNSLKMDKSDIITKRKSYFTVVDENENEYPFMSDEEPNRQYKN